MSKVRVGINGFGRIGRNVLRSIKHRYSDVIEVVAVNDLANINTCAHLFKYDSTYGTYNGDVLVDERGLIVDGNNIRVFNESDPGKIGWAEEKVDIVIESTGRFTDAELAKAHIAGGNVSKVIISAPAKNEDITIVLGVNVDQYDSDLHHIISNASCTTNCLALPAKVVNDAFGIRSGVMTTIHSYTNDQPTLDVFHKDLRRARAAAQNIIPTTTGAARAVSRVIPELEGKFDGYALRVPTASVSIVDFTAILKENVSVDDVNDVLRNASNDGPMQGYLGYSDEPLVSSDFKGDPRSSIIDSQSTIVMGDNVVKVVAWYDNEWGYACRTADLAVLLSKSL